MNNVFPTTLPLFSSCKKVFSPTTDWLDGQCPAHPFFDDDLRIQEIIRNIKTGLLDTVLDGCEILLRRSINDGSQLQLLASIDELPELWKAIISVHKYGVIYLANRSESTASFYPLYTAHICLADQIDAFLYNQSNGIRAINYAVHKWINNSKNQIEYPPKLVPPNAISSIGKRHFAVRACDFKHSSSELFLEDTSVLWDLHDFAHQTTACLSKELYGSKYFSHLIHLPLRATALIRSPGMRTTGKGPRMSDGIIFSELLTGLFTAEVDSVISGDKSHTYASMQETLAIALAEYLLGKRALLHPSTNNLVLLDRAIYSHELAVLVQNKAYELPASEIEQRVFTRGGPAGDKRDLLDSLTAGARLDLLAHNRTWMYFEVRNTVKHRAHKDAYRIVAERMLAMSDSEEKRLCRTIVDVLDYKDWETCGPLNLWELVAKEALFVKMESSSSSSSGGSIGSRSSVSGTS
jgi:hypothetical protein